MVCRMPRIRAETAWVVRNSRTGWGNPADGSTGWQNGRQIHSHWLVCGQAMSVAVRFGDRQPRVNTRGFNDIINGLKDFYRVAVQ